MLPQGSLQDRVAIITGGGTGIGRAIAFEYARLGAKLVLASRSVEHLEPTAKELEANGYRTFHLTGDLPQKDRLRVIRNFMDGKFPILVATDVAARGLDIEDLEMVINYDIPQDYENYVHRIGRTARAGKGGKAITLASEGTADHLEAIERFIGLKIPVKPVTNDLFARDMSLEKMPRHGWGQGPHAAGGRSGRNRRPSGRGRAFGSGRSHSGPRR